LLHKELVFQNQEKKEKRAAELIHIANKELAFRINEEKEKSNPACQNR
jgi:hypothetical protein